MTPDGDQINDEMWFLHVKLRTQAPISAGAGALAAMTHEIERAA